MSYMDKINQVIETLTVKGLDKNAAEITQVKESMFSEIPIISSAKNKSGTPNPDIKGEEILDNTLVKEKLASILTCLDKLGYTILVKNLSNAMGDFKIASGDVVENHSIPSIEEIYEESSSPNDFSKEVKRLIGVHDKIIDLVKKFDKDVDKMKLDNISEDKAVKKTVKLVRDVGKATDSEINKIS